MNLPGESFYDRIKDRRYGNLFCFAFFGILGPLLVVSRLPKDTLAGLAPWSGAPLLLALAGILRSVRRSRRGSGPLRLPRLSSHDLRVAREKLSKNGVRKFGR
jgi:hypothetical protein